MNIIVRLNLCAAFTFHMFYSSSTVWSFDIVSFACVHAASYGVINDYNNKDWLTEYDARQVRHLTCGYLPRCRAKSPFSPVQTALLGDNSTIIL